MSCDNRWTGEFQLTGSGKTEKAAADDFDTQLTDKLKPYSEKLDCSKKTCITEDQLGDQPTLECLFTYELKGDDKPKPVEREVYVFRDKKFVKATLKSYERNCTVKYGCWCFEIGPK